MEVFLLGIATAANFILLKWKWDRGRIEDLTWDLVILTALSIMFGGTMTGMAIAMIGGAFISLYLIASTKGPKRGNPKSN